MNDLTYSYRVHGLVFSSDLEFPELVHLSAGTMSTPDIRVRVAKSAVDAATKPTAIPDLSLTSDGLVLSVRGAGQFLVRPDEVLIAIDENADMPLLRLFFFGSVMGLLCQLRGLLALHASAVVFDDHAVAFCGLTGMGKSTLAAYCVEAGARLAADDILTVSLTDRAAMANPGMPKIKLWRNALDSLGRDTDGLVPDLTRAEKYHVSAHENLIGQPVRLSRVYVLENDDSAGAGIPSLYKGAISVSSLISNTYRPEYLDVTGARTKHFADCVRLASMVEVVRLGRSREKNHLPDTAKLVRDLSRADHRLQIAAKLAPLSEARR